MALIEIPDHLTVQLQHAVEEGRYAGLAEAVAGLLSGSLDAGHDMDDESLQDTADIGIRAMQAGDYASFGAQDADLDRMWKAASVHRANSR